MNDTYSICVPKLIVRITICGALRVDVHEDMGFIFPTEEQLKNLKEMLCIEVEDLRKETE